MGSGGPYEKTENRGTNETGVTHYSPPPVAPIDLDNLFTYHAPTNDQLVRYMRLRAKAKEFASIIVEYCPPSADTTAAIRQLRECLMTANAAIACNESGGLKSK